MTTPETPQVPQQSAPVSPSYAPALTVPAKRRRWPWIAAAVLVGVTVPTVTWAATRDSLADHASQQCQDQVRGKLKAPASAQFINVKVEDRRNGHFKISGEVDAQNGFGALIRGPFSCEMYTQNGGGEWHVNSLKVD